MRHLADYVLVWIGDDSSDMGKSIHMAKIAQSIFKGHCAEDDCEAYGYLRGRPSPMMEQSVMFKLDARDHDGTKSAHTPHPANQPRTWPDPPSPGRLAAFGTTTCSKRFTRASEVGCASSVSKAPPTPPRCLGWYPCVVTPSQPRCRLAMAGISEESKRFGADPASKQCDAPGSWCGPCRAL